MFHKRARRAKSHRETSHTEHVLIFVVDGWIEMHSGAPVRAEAGSFMLVPAGVPHRGLGNRSECWYVSFCASCLRLDEAQPLMTPFRRVRAGAVPVVSVTVRRRARVLRLFRDLKEEDERNVPEAQDLTRSLLLLLLGEIRRAAPEPDAPQLPAGSLVAEALEYIQVHAFEPISLRDVAASVCRTPAHVAATVKDATGYAVGDWLRAARVAEAAAWLAHCDASLDEIAARVGWQDKTHFIRQFKKVYGQTPAAWRRAQRTAHADVDPRSGRGDARTGLRSPP